MLHTQQHIHVYNRQKNEAIVVRKSATKNDFAVKTKFFYFFFSFALYAGRSCTYKVKHYDSYQQCCQLISLHKIVLKLAPLNTKMLFSKEAKLDTNLGPPISCVSFLATSTYYHIYPLQKQPPLEMIHFNGDIYEKQVLQHLLPFTISKIFHFSRQKLVLR